MPPTIPPAAARGQAAQFPSRSVSKPAVQFSRHPGASLHHPGASLRHSGASRNLGQYCVNHPYAEAAPNRHYRIPQPSFRRKPESMPAASIADSPNHHPGASRNPCLPAPSPSPSTVIPAQAGIYACRPHCRLPQPPFRRKPESKACGHLHRHSGFPNRHSDASRNLVQHCANHPYAVATPNRHSGASRNLWRAVTFPVNPTPPTVIPAQAGIHACRPHCRLPQPPFRRKPESMPAASIAASPNRHSGESRNLGRKETLPPAPAKLPISQSNLP